MRTIHKYKLDITDRQPVETYEGAQFIHVGRQGDDLCLWAIVDTDMPQVAKVVFVKGTGNPLPPDALAHVGSAQVGVYVWHVFV